MEALISRGAIELYRLRELPGRVLTDAFVLAEGMETASHDELKGLVVSALGRGCKLVIAGRSGPACTRAGIAPGHPGIDAELDGGRRPSGVAVPSPDAVCRSISDGGSISGTVSILGIRPFAGTGSISVTGPVSGVGSNSVPHPLRSAFADFADEVAARGGPRMACVRLPDFVAPLHPTASHALDLFARIETAGGARAAGGREMGATARASVFSRLGTARACPHPRSVTLPAVCSHVGAAAWVSSPMLVDGIGDADSLPAGWPPASCLGCQLPPLVVGSVSLLATESHGVSVPPSPIHSLAGAGGGTKNVVCLCDGERNAPAGDRRDELRGSFCLKQGGSTPNPRAAVPCPALAYESSSPDSDIHSPRRGHSQPTPTSLL